MEIELKKKPKSGAIIIEGFPGFGLVSTIVTEFLIDHLEAKQIGKIKSDKITPIIALHKGEILEPFGVFYAEKENIVIVRGISPAKDIEWDVTRALQKLSKDIKAREIISIEGVNSDGKPPEPEAFYYSSDKSKIKKFESMQVKKMDEGVIMGVTAALLSTVPETTCLFTEAYSNLPDSRAAAKMVEVLDRYLDLEVDFGPLIKKAEGFETKIKGIIEQSMNAVKQKNRIDSKTSYLG